VAGYRTATLLAGLLDERKQERRKQFDSPAGFGLGKEDLEVRRKRSGRPME
jgi:hypothetical protein